MRREEPKQSALFWEAYGGGGRGREDWGSIKLAFTIGVVRDGTSPETIALFLKSPAASGGPGTQKLHNAFAKKKEGKILIIFLKRVVRGDRRGRTPSSICCGRSKGKIRK